VYFAWLIFNEKVVVALAVAYVFQTKPRPLLSSHYPAGVSFPFPLTPGEFQQANPSFATPLTSANFQQAKPNCLLSVAVSFATPLTPANFQ